MIDTSFQTSNFLESESFMFSKKSSAAFPETHIIYIGECTCHTQSLTAKVPAHSTRWASANSQESDTGVHLKAKPNRSGMYILFKDFIHFFKLHLFFSVCPCLCYGQVCRSENNGQSSFNCFHHIGLRYQTQQTPLHKGVCTKATQSHLPWFQRYSKGKPSPQWEHRVPYIWVQKSVARKICQAGLLFQRVLDSQLQEGFPGIPQKPTECT